MGPAAGDRAGGSAVVQAGSTQGLWLADPGDRHPSCKTYLWPPQRPALRPAPGGPVGPLQVRVAHPAAGSADSHQVPLLMVARLTTPLPRRLIPLLSQQQARQRQWPGGGVCGHDGEATIHPWTYLCACRTYGQFATPSCPHPVCVYVRQAPWCNRKQAEEGGK